MNFQLVPFKRSDGQRGLAMVDITDTRTIPSTKEELREVILGIVRGAEGNDVIEVADAFLDVIWGERISIVEIGAS